MLLRSIRKILLMIFLMIPINVNATSGCCSHHGGVDCSERQSNGQVICNDGWRGSSCSYSGMVKCNGFSPDILDDNSKNNSKTNLKNIKSNSESDGIIGIAIASGAGYGIYRYYKKKTSKIKV